VNIYRSDFDTFVEFARQHIYFEWFIKVCVARFAPEQRDNPVAVREMYSQRLRKSAELYNNIMEHGFDRTSPIIPYTSPLVLPTNTGKVTGEKYYMGDGCHRLACLMAMGYMTLPKQLIRVKCFNRLIPLDNTRLLSPHLPIDWPKNFTD